MTDYGFPGLDQASWHPIRTSVAAIGLSDMDADSVSQALSDSNQPIKRMDQVFGFVSNNIIFSNTI